MRAVVNAGPSCRAPPTIRRPLQGCPRRGHLEASSGSESGYDSAGNKRKRGPQPRKALNGAAAGGQQYRQYRRISSCSSCSGRRSRCQRAAAAAAAACCGRTPSPPRSLPQAPPQAPPGGPPPPCRLAAEPRIRWPLACSSTVCAGPLCGARGEPGPQQPGRQPKQQPRRIWTVAAARRQQPAAPFQQ
jgi:hypothetical protein